MKPDNYEKIPEEFTEDKFMVDLKKQDNNIMQEGEKFEFLTSLRFWSLVVGAVTYYLQVKGIVGEAEMVLVNTILGGFIVTKTVDRFGEQKVEAAKVAGTSTVVSIPSNVTSVQASTDKAPAVY